jgi:Ca2+-binding RTX toxin-like protein
MRRLTRIGLVVAVGGLPLAIAPAARAAPSCFGKPATLVGSKRSETLRGTARADVIVSLGGSDDVFGGGGDDRICAGSGRDLVVGGEGRDAMSGGGHADRIYGAAARAYDPRGNSYSRSREESDVLDGGSGDDTLRGGGANDALVGGGGDDRLFGEFDDDDIDGGAGDDAIETGHEDELSSFDTAFGGPGNDRMTSLDPGRDLVKGGSGDDELIAGRGRDNLWGGDGDDHLEGGRVIFVDAPAGVSADLVSGRATGQGSDVIVDGEGIVGSSFGDVLGGDDDNDHLSAGAGDDVVDARGGNDQIHVGTGRDRVTGGGGDDVVYDFDNEACADAAGCGSVDDDRFDGGDGTDQVDYEAPTGVKVDLSLDTATGAGADALPGIEDLSATRHADTVIGDEGPNAVYASDGADRIEGRGGDDWILDDDGGRALDVVLGGDGADLLWVRGGGASRVFGGEGDDHLYGGPGPSKVWGGGGDDLILGGAGDDLVNGGEGVDTMYFRDLYTPVTVDLTAGTGTKVDGTDTYVSLENVWGGFVDDVLIGDDGPNVLIGGYGDDSLEGRGGDDELDGHTGGPPVPDDGHHDELDGGEGTDRCANGETVTRCEVPA